MHHTRISFFGVSFLKLILGDTERPHYKNSIYTNFSFKIIDLSFRKWHTGTRSLISKCALYIDKSELNINTIPRGMWYSFRFFNTLFMQLAKRGLQSYRMSKHFIKELGRHTFVFVRLFLKKDI